MKPPAKKRKVLECESEKINAMSLDQFNELKLEIQKKMKIIQEAETKQMFQ